MFRRFEMLWRCTTARTASGRRETGDCPLVVGGLDGEVGVPPW